MPERLEEVVERLRSIRIENRDARDLVEMFSDRPATLMYLDPPYFVKRSHEYVIDANDEGFHTELLVACKKSKCMILISSYETPLYDELLRESDGWAKEYIETHTRDTTGKDYLRKEVLWMNAAYVNAQKTQRVPVRLSEKEKTQNKVNPSRK